MIPAWLIPIQNTKLVMKKPPHHGPVQTSHSDALVEHVPERACSRQEYDEQKEDEAGPPPDGVGHSVEEVLVYLFLR